MKVGITGGIGCGKSTVGLLLETAGFNRCDADGLVQGLLASDTDVIAAIVAHFGADFLNAEGGICRQKLADVVFYDRSELVWLEHLLHPRVQLIWQKSLANSPDSDWCIEIPLLFEKNLEKYFDLIVCVSCSPAHQLSRLLAKGLSEEQALARIAVQMPLDLKMERSDLVFANDGSESFLKAQLDYFIVNFVRTNLL